ncbi:MAG: FGGY family carbohydrate kinase, partial [Pseudomonadota bacterium]
MTLALGIDIGTSGIRTAVLDENDQVVSTARAGHLPQTADKIDATLWWEAVQTCIEAQTNALKTEGHDPGAIIHIAIDGTSGTMVATDEKLQPVSRALMYNSKGFDAEAGRIAAHAPDNHITL